MSGKRMPDAERFWRHVDKSGGPDACWSWTAHCNERGYGVTTKRNDDGEHVQCFAHRRSYELANGPMPRRMLACHRCDNPPCVNPAHLFAGSHSDNMRDCSAKGRHHKQRKTHCSKGHEYTHRNTALTPSGVKRCRTCANARARGWKRKNTDKTSASFKRWRTKQKGIAA